MNNYFAKLALLFTFSITLFSTQGHCVEELMRKYRPVRALGMGGVIHTTGLYDEALFGNPATQLNAPAKKKAVFNMTLEANPNFIGDIGTVIDVMGATGTDVLSKVADAELAGKNEHYRVAILPGYYDPQFFDERTSFSLGFLISNQTNLMLRSHAEVEMQVLVDIGPTVGVARRFLDDKLNIGVNLHVGYRVSADRTLTASDLISGQRLTLSSIGKQGFGVDADVGAYYSIPYTVPFFKKISFGGSIGNLLMSTYQIGGNDLFKAVGAVPQRNDRTFNSGIRMDLPEYRFLRDNLFAIEFQGVGSTTRLTSTWKQIHFGGETRLSRVFTFRAGLNQGYPSAGIGVDLPVFKADIATYGEELGSNAGQLQDRRVALRLAAEL